MAIHIQCVSENWCGADGVQRRAGTKLHLVSSNLFARDVIAERARQDYRLNRAETTGPIAIPQSDLMHCLDKVRLPVEDEEEAVSVALKGFEGGAFLFFWNDRQVEDLDEKLAERDENEALFVKLVPLVGG